MTIQTQLTALCFESKLTPICCSCLAVFTPFTGPANQALGSPSLLLQKLTFLACQLGLLAVGCWKLNQLGLLPTVSKLIFGCTQMAS